MKCYQKHPECTKVAAKNLKKGRDEKEMKSKWAVKAGVVLVLMHKKIFNNHNSGCKTLTA